MTHKEAYLRGFLTKLANGMPMGYPIGTTALNDPPRNPFQESKLTGMEPTKATTGKSQTPMDVKPYKKPQAPSGPYGT